MGGRGSRSGLTSAVLAAAVPTPAPAPAAVAAPQIDANGFSDTDTADFHNLFAGAQYYQRQNLDIDTRTALTDYLDPDTTPGSLYNFSQNMNWAIQNGQRLTAQQQYARDSIVDATHNAGYNLLLTRYDHADALDSILKQVGIGGGRGNMSVAQLKKVLVGQTYSDNRILSTTYNNFKNATNPATFTSREIKFTYKTKAGAQVLMPGKGKGGDFGEMLLAPTGTRGHNNPRIVDVKLSGAKARGKGGSVYNLTKNQIEIVVEYD